MVSSVLEGKTYHSTEAQTWAADISEQVVLALKDISTEYKYGVTCVLLQKGEAGVHISSNYFWDFTRDGSFVVKWENDSMHCVLTVMAMVF